MKSEKMFECSDDDFMAKGHDKEELKMVARMHLKNKHGMEASDEELEAKIKEM